MRGGALTGSKVRSRQAFPGYAGNTGCGVLIIAFRDQAPVHIAFQVVLSVNSGGVGEYEVIVWVYETCSYKLRDESMTSGLCLLGCNNLGTLLAFSYVRMT